MITFDATSVRSAAESKGSPVAAAWEMVTLSSVRLPLVAPRRTRRTWVPPAVRSFRLNRWTAQNPSWSGASSVSVPVNATVNVVADAMFEAASEGSPSSSARTWYR